MKSKLEDYTEDEFKSLINKIRCPSQASEEEKIELVLQFKALCEHPDGSDLIFWPDPSADNSTDGIVATIKQWRAAQGKPGFKHS